MTRHRRHARKLNLEDVQAAGARHGRAVGRVIAWLMTPFMVVAFAVHGFVVAGLFGARTFREERECAERARQAFEATPLGQSLSAAARKMRGEAE